jgi:hypothetical protein
MAASPSLATHADAINLHVYPTDGFGPNSSFRRLFGAVRQVRDAAGATELPLLVTELGATTSGPRRLTEVEQSRRVLGALRRIEAMQDALGALVYTLSDRREMSPADPERGYGAVRPGPGARGASFSSKDLYERLMRRAGD